MKGSYTLDHFLLFLLLYFQSLYQAPQWENFHSVCQYKLPTHALAGNRTLNTGPAHRWCPSCHKYPAAQKHWFDVIVLFCTAVRKSRQWQLKPAMKFGGLRFWGVGQLSIPIYSVHRPQHPGFYWSNTVQVVYLGFCFNGQNTTRILQEPDQSWND